MADYKHGFPVEVPFEQAQKQALQAIRDSGDDAEITSGPTFLQTPAHAEAGEFLVVYSTGQARAHPQPG